MQKLPNESEHITLNVDKPTKAMLKELARVYGLSQSGLIRDLIENAWNVHKALQDTKEGDNDC